MPTADVVLPFGCEVAARIDLPALRARMAGPSLDAIAGLAGAEGLRFLSSLGLDPFCDFYTAEICRRRTGWGQESLFRFVGRIPSDFVAKVGRGPGNEVVNWGGVMVLRRGRVLMTQPSGRELVFGDSTDILRDALERRGMRYAFRPEALAELLFDRAGFRRLVREMDSTKLPEIGPVEAMSMSIARSGRNVRIGLAVGRERQAIELGHAVARMIGDLRWTKRISVDPEVQTEGREAVVTFPIPEGTVEGLFAGMRGSPAAPAAR